MHELYAASDFKPYWDELVSDTTYHEIKWAVGSSDIRQALDSPKAFYWSFFKGVNRPENTALRLGKIIHLAVLEGAKFKDRYVVMPEFVGLTKDGRPSAQSKEAKDKKQAWLNDLPADKLVVSKEELDMILGIVDGIFEHQDAANLFKNGRPEITGFFKHLETGITCKIRPDFLSHSSKILVDLKTSSTSARMGFGSKAFDYRYDAQAAQYRTGVHAITGIKPEIIAQVVVEKNPPYECAVYYFEDSDLIQGEIDIDRGLRKIKQCLDTGKWPQRQTKIERIYTPQWFFYSSTDNQELEQ